MIRQVRGRLHHAPRVARGADATALAGIGHKVVVPTVIAPRPGKTVGKDAAFEVFAKGLADVGFVCELRQCATQRVQRTGCAAGRHLQHMRVDHRGADIGVAEQLLHGTDVGAGLQ